jgi:ribosomal protein S18 acetylase RimI-like enzyme
MVTIKELNYEDLEEVVELANIRTLFGEPFLSPMNFTQAYKKANYMILNGHKIFIAETDQIVGFLYTQKNKGFYISSMGSLLENQGIGNKLLNQAISTAKFEGENKVYGLTQIIKTPLEIIENDSMNYLFEKNGFSKEKVNSGYLYSKEI